MPPAVVGCVLLMCRRILVVFPEVSKLAENVTRVVSLATSTVCAVVLDFTCSRPNIGLGSAPLGCGTFMKLSLVFWLVCLSFFNYSCHMINCSVISQKPSESLVVEYMGSSVFCGTQFFVLEKLFWK